MGLFHRSVSRFIYPVNKKDCLFPKRRYDAKSLHARPVVLCRARLR